MKLDPIPVACESCQSPSLAEFEEYQASDARKVILKKPYHCGFGFAIQGLRRILPIDCNFFLKCYIAGINDLGHMMDTDPEGPSFHDRPEVRVFSAAVR